MLPFGNGAAKAVKPTQHHAYLIDMPLRLLSARVQFGTASEEKATQKPKNYDIAKVFHWLSYNVSPLALMVAMIDST